VDKIKKIGIGFGIFVASFFILIVIVAVTNFEQDKEEQELKSELRSMSIQELEELSVHWEYDDILRNIERYEGKIIYFEGKIWRVESLGGDHYVLTVREGGGLDILIVDYTGSRVLDGDNIGVYGEVWKVIEVGSMLAPDFKSPYPVVKAIQLICYNC